MWKFPYPVDTRLSTEVMTSGAAEVVIWPEGFVESSNQVEQSLPAALIRKRTLSFITTLTVTQPESACVHIKCLYPLYSTIINLKWSNQDVSDLNFCINSRHLTKIPPIIWCGLFSHYFMTIAEFAFGSWQCTEAKWQKSCHCPNAYRPDYTVALESLWTLWNLLDFCINDLKLLLIKLVWKSVDRQSNLKTKTLYLTIYLLRKLI